MDLEKEEKEKHTGLTAMQTKCEVAVNNRKET
jgi:hypothetical protein